MLDLSEQSTTSSSMLLLRPPIMSSASNQSTLDHCHETMKQFSNQMVPMPAADVLSNNDKTSQSYSRLPQPQDPSYHRINNSSNNSINNSTTSNGTLIHLPTALIQMSAVATNNRTNILMPQGLMTAGSSQPTRYLRHPPLVSRQSSVTLAPQHHSHHHHHHYSQQQQQSIASHHPSSTPHNPNLQGMMPQVSSNKNNRQQHIHNSQTSMLNNQVQQPPSTPDNQTFIDCMSSMLKYMHQGFNEDPNLKGLLLPPAPVITTAKPKRRRRRSRTLKLGEEEEEIIKQEEREEFQKVLESQFNASAPEEIVKPLPECIGTPFCFNMQQHQLSNHPHHQAERDSSSFSATEHLMMILLQYQSFRSFPFYTEDEQGQQEQIKLQKQRRHELMKQKRAIRRERRKEMKNKKRVNDGSHEASSQNKRARMSLSGAENSVHHTHDESSNHLTDEDEFSLLFNSDQDEESLDGNGGMSLDGFSDEEDDDLSDEEDEEDDDSEEAEENDEENNDGIDVDCLPTPINHLLLSPIAPSVFDSSTIDNSNLSAKTSKGFTNLPTPSTADMDFYLTPSSFFAQLPTPVPQLSSQQHSLLTVRSAGTQVSPKTNFNTMFEQTLLHQKSDETKVSRK